MFKIISGEKYKELKNYKGKYEEYREAVKTLSKKLQQEQFDHEALKTKYHTANSKMGGYTKENNKLTKENANLQELVENLTAQNKLLEKEREDRTLTINNLDSQLAKAKEVIAQLEEKVKNYEKRPSLEELKTEKMNKVDRSKLVGKKIRNGK